MNVVDYDNAKDIAKAINRYIKIKDWVASTAYIIGQYVNNDGVLYKCTTANNDATFDPTNWQKVAGGGLDEWEPSTIYLVDDVVIYNNKIYQCNTAHTSGATFLPDEAKWTEISACITRIPNWVANEDYVVGDLVAYDAKIYRCITAHTSGSTFDSTEEAKWEELSPTINEISLWAAATDYEVGQLVIYNNKLFRCTTAHTSTSSFNSDINNWQEIGGNDIDSWQPSTTYKVGEFVYKDGQIYRCTTAHTSDSSDFYVDITNWELLDTKWRAENWTASKYYAIGDVVLYDNRLFKCITANTSSSSDFATDYDKWSAISSKLELWKASTYYAVGDIVIYNNKLYRCKTGHTSTTTLSADIANWDLVSSGTIDNWKSNEDYNVNNVVIYNNKIYQCKTAHSAGSTFDYSKWKEISSSDIDLWASNFSYIVGDIVIYDNQLYRCKTAHTSTSDFNDTRINWDILDIKLLPKNWASNTYYLQGEVVLYDNTPYRCTTAHTSLGTFELDKGNWEPLNANIRTWTTGTSYKVGDIVLKDKELLRCKVANNDNGFKAQNWEIISKCSIGMWKQGPDPDILALLHFEIASEPGYNEYGASFENLPNEHGNYFVTHTGGKWGNCGSLEGPTTGGSTSMNDAARLVSPYYSFSNGETYTIEFWMYIRGDSFYNHKFGYIDSLGTIVNLRHVLFPGTSYEHASGVDLHGWHHYALVISSTTCVVFLDGVKNYEFTRPNSNSIRLIHYSDNWADPTYGQGKVDEIRITKRALYTSNFTPQNSPFTTPYFDGYAVGDLVVYNDKIYRCITANTDLEFTPSKWVEISKPQLPLWETSTPYVVGDIVIYNNQIYQCNTAHTSGTNFDTTKWTKLSVNTSLDTFGRVGDITYQYSILENHLPLDGSVISDFSVKYSELLQFFQLNNLIASTQADYDANKALCYYDSSTDEMTMPDFLDKTIWGDTTIEEKEAGLPNIEGSLGYTMSFNAATPVGSGSMYWGDASVYKMSYESGNSNMGINFDASRSNPIYGNSTTVQPPAIGLIPQIRYKADSLTDLTKIKEILYTGISYNTSTVTVETSSSMFNYDYLIIKLAYSEDGTTVNMNRTFAVVPVIGEVIDYSYFEATTSYIVIHGEVVDSTHYKFTVPELQGITNFKVVEIDGVVFAREASVFAKDWASNTSYKAGDLVIYGNGIYQCITDHTSTSTFDDTKWKNLSIGYEKANLYTDTNFQTATTTVTTSSSMLAKDYLIVNLAYSDGINVVMNKSFHIVPSIGEVYDLSFVDTTTSYAIIRGEIVDATHFKFTFKESADLTNYKVEIIGISMGSGDSLATSTQIQSLF